MTPQSESPPSKAPPPAAALHPFAAVGGLALAVAAFLPLHPEGFSFFDLLLIELSRGALEGLLMLVGFGSPYLFGLAVMLGPVLSSKAARGVIRVPVALMHSQLALVAIVIWAAGDAVAPLALLGFAVVSGGYLVLHTARAHAEGDGPSVLWYARWGAMVVAAVAAWSELQRFGDVVLGYGLHVALAAAVLIVAAAGRRAMGGATGPSGS